MSPLFSDQRVDPGKLGDDPQVPDKLTIVPGARLGRLPVHGFAVDDGVGQLAEQLLVRHMASPWSKRTARDNQT